ncbi:MAG: class I SAM-dependent methyltransferase [Candidatus Paceibacterota bacterium]|jgi:ubiquinone/menaquinone biosynthesis C-methylase UbiE
MKSIGPSQYRIFRRLYKDAGRGMCKDCTDFVSPLSKILDFGCGSGIVGKEFEKYFNSEILGVDIIDNRVEPIPFIKYNGSDLSFLKDDTFNVVLINFVLHHCKNPKELLKENKRVSSDIIILYENLPEGIISKIMCFLHGVSFAKLFQNNSENGKFFTKKEWNKIFEEMGLKVIYSKRVSAWFNPMKEHLFILKKGV